MTNEPKLSERDRATAMALLHAGRMTVAEVARFTGVSKQRMHVLALARGIDPMARRQHYLKTQWKMARKLCVVIES